MKGYLIYWQLGAWFQIYSELDDEEKTNNAPSDPNMFSTFSLKHGWKRRLIQSVVNMKFTMVKHRYCLIPGSPRRNKELVNGEYLSLGFPIQPFLAKFGLWISWVFIGRKGNHTFFVGVEKRYPFTLRFIMKVIVITVISRHYLADPVSLHGIIIQGFSGAVRSFRRAATMYTVHWLFTLNNQGNL